MRLRILYEIGFQIFPEKISRAQGRLYASQKRVGVVTFFFCPEISLVTFVLYMSLPVPFY